MLLRRPDTRGTAEDLREAGFLPALAGNYHGEGAHVIRIKTKQFRGDVLAASNERCADVEVGGGFDLYDVSNPRNPKVLVKGFGDTGPDDGSLVGDEPVHDSHSSFMWQDGKKAYIVIVDNFEFNDVDIFDISDPRNPTSATRPLTGPTRSPGSSRRRATRTRRSSRPTTGSSWRPTKTSHRAGQGRSRSRPARTRATTRRPRWAAGRVPRSCRTTR